MRQAPHPDHRCLADTIQPDGTKAQCMRRRTRGDWCGQHADLLTAPETAHRTADHRRAAQLGYNGQEEGRIAALEAEIVRLRKVIAGYEAYERSVNDALNAGDGSYRP